MGKISKVFYQEVDPNICSIKEAAEFYYHFNLMGAHEMFLADYEKYEISQAALKNKTIADAIKNNSERPLVNSSVIAISSLRDKVVIIANIS